MHARRSCTTQTRAAAGRSPCSQAHRDTSTVSEYVLLVSRQHRAAAMSRWQLTSPSHTWLDQLVTATQQSRKHDTTPRVCCTQHSRYLETAHSHSGAESMTLRYAREMIVCKRQSCHLMMRWPSSAGWWCVGGGEEGERRGTASPYGARVGGHGEHGRIPVHPRKASIRHVSWPAVTAPRVVDSPVEGEPAKRPGQRASRMPAHRRYNGSTTQCCRPVRW